jgi:hypothetical protein
MDLEVSLQLLLRLLPSIILVALAFIAASDRKTRERWTDLLYQAGSLRPEQRSDARIQSKVKWPFLVMAAILLVWPIRYFLYATRTINIQTNSLTRAVPNSSSFTRGGAPATNSTDTATANNALSAPFGAPPAPPMPGQTDNSTSGAPAPRTNIMGTPLPP